MKTKVLAFLCSVLFLPVLQADEKEFTSPTIDLGIVVSDLEESLTFYTEAIGMISTGEFTAAKALARDAGLSPGEDLVIKKLALGKGPGATTLKLMESALKPAKTDQTYITSSLGFSYLTLRVASTKAALKRLEKAGVEVLAKGPAIVPGTEVALTVVKDPDGNFVELVGPADHL